jgi:hypothetical protein
VSSELPDAPHFHVVFTVPDGLRRLMAYNRKVLLNEFFAAVRESLDAFMRREWKCAGGVLCVLHTWGQRLNWHPHIHCLVSGGGITPEGGWRPCRGSYLFPLKALGVVFRAVALRRLRALDDAGKIAWPPGDLARKETVFLHLAADRWGIFARPTLGHTGAAVRYLARYTSRIAISDDRIEGYDAGADALTFRWLDRRSTPAATRRTTLPLGRFLSMFARHILPKGLVRIRRYGFLAPASKLRGAVPGRVPEEDPPHRDPCPNCGREDWTTRRPVRYFSGSHDDRRRSRPRPPRAPPAKKGGAKSFSLREDRRRRPVQQDVAADLHPGVSLTPSDRLVTFKQTLPAHPGAGRAYARKRSEDIICTIFYRYYLRWV